MHLMCWGCTYNFFLYITPKKLFSALGGGAPTAPPGYAYAPTPNRHTTFNAVILKR